MRGRLLQRLVRLSRQRWSVPALKHQSLGYFLLKGAADSLGAGRGPSWYERQAIQVKSQREVDQTLGPPQDVRSTIRCHTQVTTLTQHPPLNTGAN